MAVVDNSRCGLLMSAVTICDEESVKDKIKC